MVKERLPSPFPQRYTDRQWGRFVHQGRDVVQQMSSLQFALGDITLKMVPKNEPGERRGVFPIMDRYADLIGINVHTLLDYRHEAIRWPAAHRRQDESWSVHRALDALEDRFELIDRPPDGTGHWTEDQALRRAGRLPHRALTKEEKLDRVHTLLTSSENALGAAEQIIRRPDVAQRIMASPSNRRILYQAHQEQREEAAAMRLTAAHEREPEPEENEETTPRGLREPAVDYQRASREALELIGTGTAFLVDLQDMVPRLHVTEFTEREIRAILDNHRRIRAALDWCDSALASGDTTMDEELARILAEGDDTP